MDVEVVAKAAAFLFLVESIHHGGAEITEGAWGRFGTS